MRRAPGLSLYAQPPTYGHCIAGTDSTGSFTQRMYGVRRCEAGCRYNLDIRAGEDRPGRRHGGLAPEWTLSGDTMSATGPSCVLDVAAANPSGLSAADVATLFGSSTRRVEQMIKRSLAGRVAVDVMRVGSDE